jgi:hypothetical protein
VSWQQVSLGRHYAGSRCDVYVDGDLLRFFIDDVLVKTAARTNTGEVRKQTGLPHQRPGLKHNNECQGSTEVEQGHRAFVQVARLLPANDADAAFLVMPEHLGMSA